jgi:hypothetical protein
VRGREGEGWLQAGLLEVGVVGMAAAALQQHIKKTC